jgi:hypothetical protein
MSQVVVELRQRFLVLTTATIKFVKPLHSLVFTYLFLKLSLRYNRLVLLS